MAEVDENLLAQGHACRIDGNYEEAKKCYSSLLEACQDAAEVWWGFGLTIMNMGDFDEAIECLKKAVELEPESQHYLLDLGKHYAMLGMDAEAKAAFEAVIAIDPASREGAEAATQLTYY
jgi:tetratricopeptide (TPR) repeat protein